MKIKHSHNLGRPHTPLALAGLSLSLILAACGGGGGATVNTLPTPVTLAQSAQGTVTGFGSVYVDGVKIEDATAAVTQENWDGTLSNVALKLGHHVQVTHDGKGMASSVNVNAAVIGAVNVVDLTANTLTVAGQLVKVNADSTSVLPVTIYGGTNASGKDYTALADVAANDLVQVHGNAVYNSTTKVYELQATRIEAQALGTAPLVMGTVVALDATAKTFKINGLLVNYGSAMVVPAAAVLANDQPVVVWGKNGSLSNVSATPTLTAARVRLTRAAPTGTAAVGLTQLSGLVSKYDATAKTLEIQGVVVNVASATVTPKGNSLANSNYVDIKGSLGTDGVVIATDVGIRQQNTLTDTVRINLGGVISSFVDSSSYIVRGVPVDASKATLAPTCIGVTMADGVYVNVVATAQAGTAVVLASSVSCLPPPPFAMRDLLGTVSTSTVDQTAKTLSLTLSYNSAIKQSVLWSDLTVFTGITAAELSTTTAPIRVVGYLTSSNVLVAREIRVNGLANQDVFTPGSALLGALVGWSKYKMLPRR
jgi:hypothetical protein